MDAIATGIEPLKARLKATWMAGDYGMIAKNSEAWADEFIGRLSLKPGMRLLDVACGSGNVAIAAARAGANITGVDIAPNLLEQARARAATEVLTARFDEGDAEQLPYADASFDVVVSMFGAMFAPRPQLVAAELVRVCRPGGRIAMANWTPGGFAGQMFKAVGKHVPPPPGVPSPLEWGDDAIVRQRLRAGLSDLRTVKRICQIKYPLAPGEVVELFRRYFGPVHQAFAALDDDGQAALRRDLEQVWSAHNRAAGTGATEVDAEYLEVIATRS